VNPDITVLGRKSIEILILISCHMRDGIHAVAAAASKAERSPMTDLNDSASICPHLCPARKPLQTYGLAGQACVLALSSPFPCPLPSADRQLPSQEARVEK
jgi:hypothetical protein